jgi:hypothetical protein
MSQRPRGYFIGGGCLNYVVLALYYYASQQEAPAVLYDFAKHLDYFLSYFPYPKPGIRPLIELRAGLLRGYDHKNTEGSII